MNNTVFKQLSNVKEHALNKSLLLVILFLLGISCGSLNNIKSSDRKLVSGKIQDLIDFVEQAPPKSPSSSMGAGSNPDSNCHPVKIDNISKEKDLSQLMKDYIVKDGGNFNDIDNIIKEVSSIHDEKKHYCKEIKCNNQIENIFENQNVTIGFSKKIKKKKTCNLLGTINLSEIMNLRLLNIKYYFGENSKKDEGKYVEFVFKFNNDDKEGVFLVKVITDNYVDNCNQYDLKIVNKFTSKKTPFEIDTEEEEKLKKIKSKIYKKLIAKDFIDYTEKCEETILEKLKFYTLNERGYKHYSCAKKADWVEKGIDNVKNEVMTQLRDYLCKIESKYILTDFNYYSKIKTKDKYTQLLISGWQNVIYKCQGHKIDLIFPLEIFGAKSKLALAIMPDGSCKCSSIYPIRKRRKKFNTYERKEREKYERSISTMNDIPDDKDSTDWGRTTLSGFIQRFKNLALANNVDCSGLILKSRLSNLGDIDHGIVKKLRTLLVSLRINLCVKKIHACNKSKDQKSCAILNQQQKTGLEEGIRKITCTLKCSKSKQTLQ